MNRIVGADDAIAPLSIERDRIAARKTRVPANAMRIVFIAPDFDEPDPWVERLFAGELDDCGP